MRSSFKKLRDFTLNKSASKDKRSTSDHHRHQGNDMEAITASMKVLTNMREQYDGLLAAAHSISGSSYDFSRSIHEMASYMLDTFGKIGDGDTGSSFSMLGKVQYEISKLLDLYAAHVSQMIIKPTEKLLKELESVEEIKKQYEEKWELYNRMSLQKVKGRRKKGDTLDQQLTTIKEQINDKAALLDLRFESLRHEREVSLITQAARHHMAQVHLFGKGLNSLNAVESMVKHLSDEFHIDKMLSDGDMGNGNSYEVGVEFLGNDDEEESTASSPSSSEPIAGERSEQIMPRAAGTPKMWENISKSAPLHPSLLVAPKSPPLVPDMDEEMASEKELATYVLPSPTGPTARLYTQVTNSGIKAEASCCGDVPEFRRIRTGSAGSFEETRGLVGISKVETYKPRDLGHAMAREEEMNTWKEKRSSYNARRSPNHSHSTSYSEGLDPLSVSSYAHLASTPTFSYKQISDNDTNVGVTHGVDPLYRSGPIGRSAPWGLTPLRVSPCSSPPVSHLSPPLISELHKLPAPPPAAPKLDPVIMYSAPLGRKGPELGHRSAVATKPIGSSSALAVVKKSRSIPSSVNFSGDMHNTKPIKSDDSPVIESP